MTTSVFRSFQELEQAAAYYRDQKMVVLAADTPLEGSVGYLVFATDSSPEPLFHLEWFPFGRISNSVIEKVRNYNAETSTYDSNIVSEALAKVASKRIFRADDPRARELGYVYYENGSAHCLRLTLTSVKASANIQIDGTPFKDWHQTVPDLRSVAASI